MTLLNFHRLSLFEQQSHVVEYGVHVMDRQEPNYLINLYCIDGFYVELYFYRINKTPLKIKAFESTKLLEPYLNHIDLSQLFSPS